ncbi:MAG: amidohydrolase family protein [Chitinophagaceae bacterium]
MKIIILRIAPWNDGHVTFSFPGGKNTGLPNVLQRYFCAMGFLKFQATQLFDGHSLLDGEHVVIAGKKGDIQDIVLRENAGDDIQQLEGILSPGFINAHCHLELSHLKGMIPEHTGLIDFVFTIVTQRHLPEEAISSAIITAEDEMLKNGIVAVGDICNNNSTLFQKQKGRLAYYNFLEVSGWLPEMADARFQRSKGVYDTFNALPGESNKQQFAAHAPYSVSPALWEKINPFFHGTTTTIHNQETAFEDELFKKGTGDFLRMYQKMGIDNNFFKPTGLTSLQSYLPKMTNAKQLLLVHNTFTTEEDILFSHRQGININWCLCVNANQYIEDALPPLELLRKHGSKIVLGTDSLASNHSLSILDEMKTITSYFPQIPIEEMLRWATINGAEALQMEERLGSFEKGKQPGIVLIKGLNEGVFQPCATIQRLA